MAYIEGQQYQTTLGVLIYSGLYEGGGWYCHACGRQRRFVHEFHKGVYPQHTEQYMWGSECVKRFVIKKEARE